MNDAMTNIDIVLKNLKYKTRWEENQKSDNDSRMIKNENYKLMESVYLGITSWWASHGRSFILKEEIQNG